MRPDSLLRRWRYINHLLTYILILIKQICLLHVLLLCMEDVAVCAIVIAMRLFLLLRHNFDTFQDN